MQITRVAGRSEPGLLTSAPDREKLNMNMAVAVDVAYKKLMR